MEDERERLNVEWSGAPQQRGINMLNRRGDTHKQDGGFGFEELKMWLFGWMKTVPEHFLTIVVCENITDFGVF